MRLVGYVYFGVPAKSARGYDITYSRSPRWQVILEPGIGQFREFESPRVHTRMNSWGLFSCAQNDLRKARERELATLDEKSTSTGIAEPLCAKRIEVKNWGEEGMTPVTTVCPEAGK